MNTAPLATALTCLRTEAASREPERRSDGQLLRAYAAANDQGAFTALVKRHGPMVLGVCRRVLQDAHEAEDAFQAAFLVLARKAAGLRNGEALTSWLHGVAYRVALRARRDAGRRRKRESRVVPRVNAAAWEVGWRELQAVLDEEVAKLPPACAAAFVLCCLEGLSKAEAAERLGVNTNTVSSRLARARKRLQQRLAQRGISLAAVLAALAVSGASRAAVAPHLADMTAAAASRLGDGMPVTGLSARAISLAEGVTPTMLSTKVKLAAVLLTLCALGIGLGVFARPFLPPAVPARAAPQMPTKAKEDSVEINGRVLGPDGRPVAGARLYQAFQAKRFEGTQSAPTRRGNSGPEGRFHFRVSKSDWIEHPKAALQVIAVADGFGPGWVRLDQAQDREITVRLAKDDVPIRGRILDLQGRPIRAATIRPVVLMASPNESLTPWLQAIRAGKRFRHEELLSKQLIGDRDPIPGLPATIATDADGRFRLTGVGRERALVVLIGGPKLLSDVAVLLTRPVPRFEAFDNPRTDDKMTVYGASFQHVAAPAKPLTGTVRDKDTGKPLAGVKVGVDQPLFQATTDKEGKFQLDSLPFDPRSDGFGLAVRALPPRDQPYLVGFKEVKRGRGLEATTVDFQLKRGVWVEGKVTNKLTGKPIRAYLEYRPAADNPHRKDAADFSRFPSLAGELYASGTDGTFRVPVLPGSGTIVARGPAVDYVAAAAVPINAPGNGKPIRCPIVLDPGRTLTGTILSPDGKPLRGVRVFNMNPLHFWTPRPLASSRFTLTAVDPRGRRSLVFLHPEKRWVKALELQGNAANPLTVRLEPAATLSGRLVDEEGQPRPDVKLLIHFVRKDTDYVAEHLPRGITTDRKGRFRVEGLAPGVVYQINLAGKSANATIGSVASRLTVKSGETKDLGDVKGKLFPD